MLNYRFFPMAVWSCVGGAAALGLSIGLAMTGPTLTTASIAFAGCLFSCLGWWMIRPFMRLSREEIKAQALAKLQPAPIHEPEAGAAAE